MAAGDMERPRPVAYRFSGQVRREDGSLVELSMIVSAPETGDASSVCELRCPFLRDRPFLIYGADGDQAVDLSRRFVKSCLEHMNAQLVDAEGAVIQLPPVPQAGT